MVAYAPYKTPAIHMQVKDTRALIHSPYNFVSFTMILNTYRRSGCSKGSMDDGAHKLFHSPSLHTVKLEREKGKYMYSVLNNLLVLFS